MVTSFSSAPAAAGGGVVVLNSTGSPNQPGLEQTWSFVNTNLGRGEEGGQQAPGVKRAHRYSVMKNVLVDGLWLVAWFIADTADYCYSNFFHDLGYEVFQLWLLISISMVPLRVVGILYFLTFALFAFLNRYTILSNSKLLRALLIIFSLVYVLTQWFAVGTPEPDSIEGMEAFFEEAPEREEEAGGAANYRYDWANWVGGHPDLSLLGTLFGTVGFLRLLLESNPRHREEPPATYTLEDGTLVKTTTEIIRHWTLRIAHARKSMQSLEFMIPVGVADTFKNSEHAYQFMLKWWGWLFISPVLLFADGLTATSLIHFAAVVFGVTIFRIRGRVFWIFFKIYPHAVKATVLVLLLVVVANIPDVAELIESDPVVWRVIGMTSADGLQTMQLSGWRVVAIWVLILQLRYFDSIHFVFQLVGVQSDTIQTQLKNFRLHQRESQRKTDTDMKLAEKKKERHETLEKLKAERIKRLTPQVMVASSDGKHRRASIAPQGPDGQLSLVFDPSVNSDRPPQMESSGRQDTDEKDSLLTDDDNNNEDVRSNTTDASFLTTTSEEKAKKKSLKEVLFEKLRAVAEEFIVRAIPHTFKDHPPDENMHLALRILIVCFWLLVRHTKQMCFLVFSINFAASGSLFDGCLSVTAWTYAQIRWPWPARWYWTGCMMYCSLGMFVKAALWLIADQGSLTGSWVQFFSVVVLNLGDSTTVNVELVRSDMILTYAAIAMIILHLSINDYYGVYFDEAMADLKADAEALEYEKEKKQKKKKKTEKKKEQEHDDDGRSHHSGESFETEEDTTLASEDDPLVGVVAPVDETVRGDLFEQQMMNAIRDIAAAGGTTTDDDGNQGGSDASDDDGTDEASPNRGGGDGINDSMAATENMLGTSKSSIRLGPGVSFFQAISKLKAVKSRRALTAGKKEESTPNSTPNTTNLPVDGTAATTTPTAGGAVPATQAADSSGSSEHGSSLNNSETYSRPPPRHFRTATAEPTGSPTDPFQTYQDSDSFPLPTTNPPPHPPPGARVLAISGESTTLAVSLGADEEGSSPFTKQPKTAANGDTSGARSPSNDRNNQTGSSSGGGSASVLEHSDVRHPEPFAFGDSFDVVDNGSDPEATDEDADSELDPREAVTMDSAHTAEAYWQQNQWLTDKDATFMERVERNIVHLIGKGLDLFTVIFTFEMGALIYSTFNYFSLAGRATGSFADSVSNNLLPGNLVVILILQVLIMVIDRIFYTLSISKRRMAVTLKFGLQWVLAITYHIAYVVWMAEIANNSANSANVSLAEGAFLLLLKLMYLYLSALQIHHGYPLFRRHDPFTWSVFRPLVLAYKVYRRIPFLWDLRVMLDWMFSNTALRFADFLKVEDLFHEVYTRYGDIEYSQTDTNPKRGTFQPIFERLVDGAIMFTLVMVLIFFPLGFYSSFNPSNKDNPVVSVELSARLSTYGTVYSSSSFYTQDVATEESIKAGLRNSLPALIPLEYLDNDARVFQYIPMAECAADSWQITPTATDNFLTQLGMIGGRLPPSPDGAAVTPFTIAMSTKVTRSGGSSGSSTEATIRDEFTLSSTQAADLYDSANLFLNSSEVNATSLVNSTQEASVVVPSLIFPYILNAPTTVTKFSAGGDLAVDCALVLRNEWNVLQESSVSYWCVECQGIFYSGNTPNATDDPDAACSANGQNCDSLGYQTAGGSSTYQNRPYNSTAPYFLFASDQIPTSTNLIPIDIGIIAFYTTFLLAVGNIVRGLLTGMAHRVVLEDLRDPRCIAELISYIYLSRGGGEDEDEKVLEDRRTRRRTVTIIDDSGLPGRNAGKSPQQLLTALELEELIFFELVDLMRAPDDLRKRTGLRTDTYNPKNGRVNMIDAYLQW